MFQGNPYDNVMLEAIHELDKGLKAGPAALRLNLLGRVSAFLRQRRAVSRLALSQSGYPKSLRIEEESA
jgi:hypothetical protein